jgi:hypothetical protein
MRNLSTLVEAPFMKEKVCPTFLTIKETSATGKLKEYLISITQMGTLPQTILTLQVIAGTHTDSALTTILKSKVGT